MRIVAFRGILYMAIVHGVLVKGHRVASGLGGDKRFPGGTIAMQMPKFLELGFDLRGIYCGTLNISVSPLSFRPLKAYALFRDVEWADGIPGEDFSFFNARISVDGVVWHSGYIYYPHPETKPEHFQPGGVVELLMPRISGIEYGMALMLDVPDSQAAWDGPAA